MISNPNVAGSIFGLFPFAVAYAAYDTNDENFDFQINRTISVRLLSIDGSP